MSTQQFSGLVHVLYDEISITINKMCSERANSANAAAKKLVGESAAASSGRSAVALSVEGKYIVSP